MSVYTVSVDGAFTTLAHDKIKSALTATLLAIKGRIIPKHASRLALVLPSTPSALSALVLSLAKTMNVPYSLKAFSEADVTNLSLIVLVKPVGENLTEELQDALASEYDAAEDRWQDNPRKHVLTVRFIPPILRTTTDKPKLITPTTLDYSEFTARRDTFDASTIQEVDNDPMDKPRIEHPGTGSSSSLANDLIYT